ncbi:MAG: CinA family protein [Sphingobium sp.]|nr:CinA family protein [Sphingobium sp.]MBP6112813.1 CinA family protein [Sphingobium sp.]MBP8672042.1 CinA family protein [Sphingobium sp.]MBP9158713.1 CinA family protein [Sphingobium sp.]MCC6482813.1 CinA family protein [Sphingomonadaceae bacterium]
MNTNAGHEGGTSAETLSPAIPQDIIDAAVSLLQKACDARIAIAAAESCTGGLLSSLLTDIEGASHIFDRGFVVYSEEAKCELLGLDRALIDRCGAVSGEVARAMAEGALAHSDSTIAVAITGYAGSAKGAQEAGLVHFACAAPGLATRHREAHFGDIGRGPTRIASLRLAIALLDDAIELIMRGHERPGKRTAAQP